MLDLLLNQDETMIVDTAREYLARELPIERLRPKATPVDLARANAGMIELGWLGVGLPENVGGSGLGLVEEMLLQRECGRFLVTPSVLATTLGAHVAIARGDQLLARHLAGGAGRAALAVPRAASKAGEAYALDWNDGDFLLAWNDEGMSLFAGEFFHDARREPCLDESVAMHAGKLDVSRPLHWVGISEAPLVPRAQVLLAAALTGLAEQACDLTVGYAKVRQQFGQPIGAFQAVKHRCADMGVRARLGWYQTCLAALKVHANDSDASYQAAAAKLVTARAAHENARAGIQIHGAIGYQAEHDAHWFMKRAQVYDRAGGAMHYLAKCIAGAPAPWETH